MYADSREQSGGTQRTKYLACDKIGDCGYGSLWLGVGGRSKSRSALACSTSMYLRIRSLPSFSSLLFLAIHLQADPVL